MPMSGQMAAALAALITDNTQIAAYPNAERWLALHTTDPTKSCLVGELSGDGYARVLLPVTTLALPKGPGVTNSEVIVFPLATGTKIPQITHGSVWDSSVGGTPITYGALSTPVNWVSGSSLSLAINAFIQLLRDTF